MVAARPREVPVFYQVLRDLGFLGEQSPTPQSGVRCTENPDPAVGVLDHREHIHRCARQGVGLEEIAGQRGVASERRNSAQVGGVFGGRVDTGLGEHFPDGRGGEGDPQYEEFALHTAIPPARILFATRSTSARIERTVRSRSGRFGRDRAPWRQASSSRCQSGPSPDALAAPGWGELV
jgi:hypothetical protein